MTSPSCPPAPAAPVPRKNHGCPDDSRDLESWVRHVNKKWLVHSDLQAQASAYLDHLSATDPARLLQSCIIVRDIIRTLGPAEDPKPRFYAGLFSLATPEEAATYLHGHLFTYSLIPAGQHLEHPCADEPAVCAQVARLREELRKCILVAQATP